MGATYLTSLATVCRAAGLVVHEVAGWERRARGSGGYDPGRPTTVMIHHTASNAPSDPTGDVAYITTGSPVAPIANLYLSRSGEVWVIAAGATNTNGAGTCNWAGGCPPNQMNTHAIGVEAANDGLGEFWPRKQQDAYVILVAALCAAYDIPADLVRAHHEYAGGRKIDPAGPSDWAVRTASWNMDRFRDDVAVELTPEPTPPPQEDDMATFPFIMRNRATGQPALVYGDGKVVGLAGEDLAAYEARFGPAIETNDVVFNDLAGKD